MYFFVQPFWDDVTAWLNEHFLVPLDHLLHCQPEETAYESGVLKKEAPYLDIEKHGVMPHLHFEMAPYIIPIFICGIQSLGTVLR